jgi:hypothetical protein
MQNTGQLMEAVEKALYPTKEHGKKLRSYREYYFTGLDGKSGERAKEIIVKKLCGGMERNA